MPPKCQGYGGQVQTIKSYLSPLLGLNEIHRIRVEPGFMLLSGAGESHPRALPEPYVNLSIHTAPIVQPLIHKTSGRTGLGVGHEAGSANPTHAGDAL